MAPNATDSPVTMDPFPEGKYALVTFDLSVTGFRLIDEIIDIGAYCKSEIEEKFSGVIMPYCDLPYSLQELYGMRVVTFGKYRQLKDCVSNAMVPSKCEIGVLTDFLDWLQKVKGDSDGVILVGYDVRKNNVVHIVQSYLRYNLLDTFSDVVKGFADICELDSTTRSCRKFILSHNEDKKLYLEAAMERASYLHKAVLKFKETDNLTFDVIKTATFAPTTAVAELNKIKEFINKETNLKPIFSCYFRPRSRGTVRSYAARLRRLLADADLEFASLAETFARKGGKDGVREIIMESVKGKPEDIDSLIEVVATHFDPEKKPADMPTLFRPRLSDSKSDKNGKRRRKSKSRSRSASQKGQRSGSKVGSVDGKPPLTEDSPLEDLGAKLAEMTMMNA